MKLDDDRRSLSDLLANALSQLSLLAQTEIRLAKAEIAQNIAAAGLGIGLIGLAAVFALPALVLLLMGVAQGLMQLGLPPAAADAIAGIGALIIAALFVFIGLSRLRPEALTPRRTLKQLQRDATAAKEHLS